MDKERLLEITESYLGTPFINGGMVKGAGVDCCTLPISIYSELTGNKYEVLTHYQADWMCRRDCKEIILPWLEKYCDKVEDLQVGDVISYRWVRAQYAHLALYLGDNRVVHCRAGRGVEITELDDPIFNGRVTGYWRAKK